MTTEPSQATKDGRDSGGRITQYERDLFTEMLADGQLHELQQDIHTYHHAGQGATAQLDRMYSTLHVAWQQRLDGFCDVLPLPHCSKGQRIYHLPVTCGWAERNTDRHFSQAQRIPRWVTEVPEWNAMVRNFHEDLLRQGRQRPDAPPQEYQGGDETGKWTHP